MCAPSQVILGEHLELLADDVADHLAWLSADEDVFARLAADKVGAPKIDHPEDVEPHPRHGTGGVERQQRVMARAQGESG
jgi:hypothetical protein